MVRPDNNKDSRPNPDPTLLTTAQVDREIAHLKELMNKDRDAQQEALKVALAQMERRLEDLNELRKAVEADRTQFVRSDVYHPAYEEMRRQRVADGEKITIIQGDVKTNTAEIAAMKSSLMWLTRLIISGLVLAIIGYVFQRLSLR